MPLLKIAEDPQSGSISGTSESIDQIVTSSSTVPDTLDWYELVKLDSHALKNVLNKHSRNEIIKSKLTYQETLFAIADYRVNTAKLAVKLQPQNIEA